MGGWSRLAQRYETKDGTKKKWFRFYAVQIRRSKLMPANYGNVVKVAFEDDALFLKIMFLFRAGHPTLRFPLSELEFQPTKVSRKQGLKIRLQGDPNIELIFFGKHKGVLLDWLNNN